MHNCETTDWKTIVSRVRHILLRIILAYCPILQHITRISRRTKITFPSFSSIVNISHPGIVKGNHWHNTKNEKFLVVKGKGVIRLRKVGDHKITEYHVSGDKLEVVDIPCGYTHNIENVGDEDMVTVMWVNEIFDPDRGDTYHEEV